MKSFLVLAIFLIGFNVSADDAGTQTAKSWVINTQMAKSCTITRADGQATYYVNVLYLRFQDGYSTTLAHVFVATPNISSSFGAFNLASGSPAFPVGTEYFAGVGRTGVEFILKVWQNGNQGEFTATNAEGAKVKVSSQPSSGADLATFVCQ